MKFSKLFFSLFLSFSLSSFSYAQSFLDLSQINQALDVEVFVNVDFALNFEAPGLVTSEISSKAIIVQVGSQNEAFQYQQGISNLAFLYQEGIENFARQEQRGVYNQAYIFQYGSNNQAFQYQYTYHNTAIIVQIGFNNQAYQYQGILGGSGYKSTIIQQGNGNLAIIYQ